MPRKKQSSRTSL